MPTHQITRHELTSPLFIRRFNAIQYRMKKRRMFDDWTDDQRLANALAHAFDAIVKDRAKAIRLPPPDDPVVSFGP